MRKHVILFLWILATLLPMAWFASFSPFYSRIFEHLFNPLWMHVLMHVLLFAILAYLLAHYLDRRMAIPPTLRVVLGVLALILVIALTQEGIQLLYKTRSLGIDEVLDVGVDLAGGSLGVMAFWRQAGNEFMGGRA